MQDNSMQHARPGHDEIAHHAYLLWEQEGRPTGRDWDFWFRAESLHSGGAKAAAAPETGTGGELKRKKRKARLPITPETTVHPMK